MQGAPIFCTGILTSTVTMVDTSPWHRLALTTAASERLESTGCQSAVRWHIQPLFDYRHPESLPNRQILCRYGERNISHPNLIRSSRNLIAIQIRKYWPIMLAI